MLSQNTRFVNRPIKLWWGGWETDTFKLGQEGWQISAEQDIYRRKMRIAINHPKLQVQSITEMEDFMYEQFLHNDMYRGITLPVMLRFKTMASEIYVDTIETGTSMSAVDFRPQMIENKVRSLGDIANFQTIVEVPKNEIYLKEANINQILEMALQKQEPEQERIRQQILRDQELKNLRMGTLHTELRLVI